MFTFTLGNRYFFHCNFDNQRFNINFAKKIGNLLAS